MCKSEAKSGVEIIRLNTMANYTKERLMNQEKGGGRNTISNVMKGKQCKHATNFQRYMHDRSCADTFMCRLRIEPHFLLISRGGEEDKKHLFTKR